MEQNYKAEQRNKENEVRWLYGIKGKKRGTDGERNRQEKG